MQILFTGVTAIKAGWHKDAAGMGTPGTHSHPSILEALDNADQHHRGEGEAGDYHQFQSVQLQFPEKYWNK